MTDPQFRYHPAGDLGLREGERLRSVRREPGLTSVILHHLTGATLAAYLRSYHRLEVRGRENLPTRPPFIVLSNHASHLDAVILAACLRGGARTSCYPLAAGDVFFESTTRTLFASMCMNALPVRRKGVTRHALDDFRARLIAGDAGFVMFPEGQRSRTGELLEFRAGIGRLLAGSNVPAVPCYIEGAFRAFPAGARVPRPAKIVVTVGRPLHFESTVNDREGWQRVAESLRSAVLSLNRTPN